MNYSFFSFVGLLLDTLSLLRGKPRLIKKGLRSLAYHVEAAFEEERNFADLRT